MSLSQLPTEIWNLIFENLKNISALRTLILVNKQFYELALPLLHARINIDSSNKLEKFLKAIKEKPQYSDYIETVSLEKLDFNQTKRADIKFLSSLMNTNMPKLKSFLLLQTSLNDYAADFKISEKLVELEISFESSNYFDYHKMTFPNLKNLKLWGPNFCSEVILHYLGFPFIDYEKFSDYIFDTDDVSEIEQNFDSLIAEGDEKSKINFPQLQKLSLIEMDSDMLYEFVYLLIVALKGLPSLQKLIVKNCDFYPDEEILKMVLSKRSPDFRFVCFDDVQ